MADPRIKQKGVDRGMTSEQIWRERDLIEQINKRSGGVDATIADLTARLSVLEAAPVKSVANGRVSTNGVGGFSSNDTTGCVVTISGVDLLFTFSTPRATPLRYDFSATYASSALRIALYQSYLAGSFVIRTLNDAGVTVSAAAASITLTFSVWDRLP